MSHNELLQFLTGEIDAENDEVHYDRDSTAFSFSRDSSSYATSIDAER
jgi:hypothetical protein